MRQTPLSHVNLRAIQDSVPNAFITGAAENKEITSLIGKFVYYKVTTNGYELREASADEVDKHFAAIRPAKVQTPKRDLSVKEIKPLDKIGFEDVAAFGVKATNRDTLHTLLLTGETAEARRPRAQERRDDCSNGLRSTATPEY